MSICFIRSPNFLADLKLPRGSTILIITETDYIGGCKLFKQTLAKFFKAHKASSIVICIRTEASSEDFALVQNFCVIELGLPLIPLNDLNQLPQLIGQILQVGFILHIFKVLS